LLAVEGLFWLSERFCWFGFNRQKGLTVLIGVAALAVVLLLMSFGFTAGLLFRWRFQFNVRSLLVLVVAVAIQCSRLEVELERARKQKSVVEVLERFDGSVAYECESCFIGHTVAPEPTGLGNFFWNLTSVDFWCRRSRTPI